MGKKYRKKIFKNRVVLFVTIVVFLFLFGNNKFRSVVKNYIRINRMKRDLVKLKEENEKIKQQLYIVQEDSFYVEEIARRELGLLKPGEIEYRFIKKEKKK
ncbi:septum formation initiator family protein [bacterium]|nr:septum formation initiator family protein [bacterium]